MKKSQFSLLVFLLIFSYSASSQTKVLQLAAKENKFEIISTSQTSLKLTSTIAQLRLTETSTAKGVFEKLEIEGFDKIYAKGAPSLPIVNKLIEIPEGAEVKYKVVSYSEEIISLGGNGIKNKIVPAQPSHFKNKSIDAQPFYFDEKLYSKNEFLAGKIVTYSYIGKTRSRRLGQLELQQVFYNPKTNELKILNNLVVEITFVNADFAKTRAEKQKYQTPYFDNINYKTINAKAIQSATQTKSVIITEQPIKYIIVSDPMFRAALQPFIEWKTKKGFKVIEAYTDNPNVGSSFVSIKTYLQNLYQHPPAGENPPTFLLLVGDVNLIPPFNSHNSGENFFTDLYFAEYTGDYMPDVIYGRFSATDVSQLKSQIDKTLEYEQYTNLDHNYLKRTLLIAGVDEDNAPTYGNGTVNYINNNFTNKDFGLDTSYTYLYKAGRVPSESLAASDSIMKNFNNGVNFINYTAHCNIIGWSEPKFTNSEVASFSNNHKYPLMIGNCCESSRFERNSFAEEVMRAVDKGAIGYIGASANSLWDEDFYWGIGYRNTISAQPLYDSNNLGAFDRLYHSHKEPVNDWFVTQGQIQIAGNMAVMASTSSYKQYYWEIYHLMGDPSLMNYLKAPDQMTVSHNPSSLTVGMSTLSVKTTPYAYVALSQNGLLLNAKTANANGVADLVFSPLEALSSVSLVITAQNKIPYNETITVDAVTSPYVVVTNKTTDISTDYGKSIKLGISVQNLAAQPYNADNVTVNISTTDPYIVSITDKTEVIGNLGARISATADNAFSFAIANNVPDQHNVLFTAEITGYYNSTKFTWYSNIYFIINAPALVVQSLLVDDQSTNNNKIFDPGETVNLVYKLSNVGHADAENIKANLTTDVESGKYFTISTPSINVGSLGIAANVNVPFNVVSQSSTPLGTKVNLFARFTAGNASQYITESTKFIPIGKLPVFYMNHLDMPSSVTTCTGKFYDSGGGDLDYLNNEDDTLTILSGSKTSMLKIVFNNFDLENGSDYLFVFDGPSVLSPAIIGSPFTGTEIPGTIISSSGSLTFVFKSDRDIVGQGWDADISCYTITKPPDCATVPVPANAGTDVFPLELSWTAKDAYEFDVYFGTTQNPPLVKTVFSPIYVPKLLPNTTYYWYVVPRNVFGSALGCSQPWTFSTGLQAYMISDTIITTCEGWFYDSGGPFKNYSTNENFTMTFLPSDVDKKMILEFTEFDVEEDQICGFDLMEIYNGISIESPRMVSNCGKLTPGRLISTDEKGALTITFHSDPTVTKAGWKAKIKCGFPDGVESIEDKLVTVFPNPSSGLFSVDLKRFVNQKVKLKIYSLDGKVIKDNLLDISSDNSKINVSLDKDLKGIFLLQITSDKERITKKIVIQ